MANVLVSGCSDIAPNAMPIMVPEIFPVSISLCSEVVVSNHSSDVMC